MITKPSAGAAIIGYACRLPGARDPEGFWDVLEGGRCTVGKIGPDRWDAARFWSPQPDAQGATYTFSAGVVDQLWDFDAEAFSISRREAEQMDPQQRMLMMVTAEAVAAAGLTEREMREATTGVFIGASSADHTHHFVGDTGSIGAHFMTGNTLSIASNRISYFYDLSGPSFTLDTACSSSLLAMDRAVKALETGEVDIAIVGGVNALLSPIPFVGFSRASMMSPRGLCRAFADGADGYVRAEGAVTFILRRVEDAVAAGDRVRGVIAATGTNLDGRTSGVALPKPEAQAALIASVHARAGWTADDLSFVEAHGTGTVAGDAAEAQGLTSALGRHRSTPLPIGSAKTNVGHLEPVSGLVGLLKAQLAMEKRLLPASLHAEELNPHIDFDAAGLVVAREQVALGDGPLAAGVSSFGFGGANVHVALRSPTAAEAPVAPATDAPITAPLILSAGTKEGLRQVASAWRDRLAAAPQDAAALVNAAGHRTDLRPHRLAAMGADAGALQAALTAHLEGRPDLSLASGQAASLAGAKTGFIFGSNGSQWAGMGRLAYEEGGVFRATYDRATEMFLDQGGEDMRALLYDDDLEARLDDVTIAQPLLLAVHMAIHEGLIDRGIVPEGVMGHSLGEMSAAWAGGALSDEDAVTLCLARSRAQLRLRGTGGMAAVLSDEATVVKALAGSGIEDIAIAAVNSPRGCTVAGGNEALKAFRTYARRTLRIAVQPLGTPYPFHSHRMEECREELLEGIKDIAPREGTIPVYSSVTGRRIGFEDMGPDHWWNNARQPVLFQHAMEAMLRDDYANFVEIGSRPVLQNYILDTARVAGRPAVAAPTLERDASVIGGMGYVAARAAATGAKFDAARVIGPRAPLTVDLPQRPWAATEIRVERTPAAFDMLLSGAQAAPLIGRRIREGEGVWSRWFDLAAEPWLSDHRFDGEAVMPGAGLAEMALEAGAKALGTEKVELADLEILAPLTMREGARVETRTSYDPDTARVRIESRIAGAEWLLHAIAAVRAAPGAALPRIEAPGEGAKLIAARTLYDQLAGIGLGYGEAFRRMASVRIAGDVAEGAFTAPAEIEKSFLVSPTALDGAFHALAPLAAVALAEKDGPGAPPRALLPVRMDRLTVLRPGVAAVSARVRMTEKPQGVLGDFDLLDADGDLVAKAEGVRFRPTRLVRNRRAEDLSWRLARHPLRARGAGAALPEALASVAALAAAVPAVAGGDAPEASDAALILDALLRRIAADAVLDRLPEGAAVQPDALLPAASGDAALIGRILLALEEDGLILRGPDGALSRNPEAEDLPEAAELVALAIAEAPTWSQGTLSALRLAERLKTRLSGEAEPADEELQDPRLAAAGDLFAALMAALPGPAPRGCRALLAGRLDRRALLAAADAPWIETLVVLTQDPQLEELARATDGKVTCAASLDAVPAGSVDLAMGVELLLDGRIDLPSLLTPLRPGGIALGLEVEPDFTGDMLSGLREGWWAETLDPASPLGLRRTGAEWAPHLESLGFAGAEATPLRTGDLPLSLVMARAPLADAAAEAPEAPALTPLTVGPDGAAPATLPAALSAALAPEAPLTVAPAQAGDVVILSAGACPGAAPAPLAARLIALRDMLRNAATSGRIWVVTRGGQQNAAAPAAEEAAVWGFARSAINELTEADIRLVDLSPAMEPDAAFAAFAALMRDPGEEREVLLTPEGREALRLERCAAPVAAARRAAAAPAGGEATLRLDCPGARSIAALRWTPTARRAPGEGEVEIEVEATGLNFRDVLWAMGMLPEEALEQGFSGAGFGMECAGVITRAGPGARLPVGSRVIAFASHAFSAHVTVPELTVNAIPADLSFEQAASLPVIYMTAKYALEDMARLEEGEIVLIHGGAGGVGLAALQIAKARGARVFATAGSPEKRALLRHLGAERVFDSRSLRFAREAVEASGGQGVDVVLNSLYGEAMVRSLDCLAPFGRFVELGKRDYYENSAIRLRPFRQNLSYFGVDADQLCAAKPDKVRRLLAGFAEDMASGALGCPPVQVFSAEGVQDAYALMRDSGHVGKIVVRAPKAPATAAAPAPQVDPEAAQLVIGGVGGFGFEAAKALTRMGARHLVLASRSGALTDDAAEPAEALRAEGVSVDVVALDVTDEAAVKALLDKIREERRLGGVIHAAMHLEDKLLDDLTVEGVERVLVSKTTGTEILDRLTRAAPLDHFVVFSSVAAAVGNPGQAAYAAANLHAEAIMLARRAEGLPGVSVAWGPVGDSGYLAREPEIAKQLARAMGAPLLKTAEAMDGLAAALRGAPAQTLIFTPPLWGGMSRNLPLLQSPAYAAVAADAGGAMAGGLDVRELVEGVDDLTAIKRLTELLCIECAAIVRQPVEEIDPDRPLTDLGFDSLMAVNLKMNAEDKLGVQIPILSLSDGATLADLASRLLAQVRSGASEGAEGAAAAQNVAARHAKGDAAVLLEGDKADQIRRKAKEVDSLIR